ncbi:MAG: hypothetical protein ACRC5A_04570 [Enterobacteriaceae bacterium]
MTNRMLTIAERLELKGLEKGREEGRRENLHKMVRQMLIRGMTLQAVMDVTDLSESEIKQIIH